MKVEIIPDASAQISIAEIFLASGNVEAARRYFETVTTTDQENPRASYYRGVLARLAGDSGARDFFVDALVDPQLGTRAAVQLVQMGELHIPSVRRLLEQAAERRTQMSDVYLALMDIAVDDMHRIEETVRLKSHVPEVLPPARASVPAPVEVQWHMYAHGSEANTRWELLSDSGSGPRIEVIDAPYYPPELIGEELAGRVVMEVEVTNHGDVAGLRLVSSEPEIFGTLATSAVRDWRFEPTAARIRVVVEFKPGME
jgi:TonB family protein